MKSGSFVIIFLLISSVLFVNFCNPVSEDVNGPLWNSLHNSKPFQSEFFHSADYRFPHGACDEVQCHGVSLAGGNSGSPSCYKCHDDQWTIFEVSHTKKISGYYHRYDVDDYPANRNSNALWFDSCKDAGCHGASLDGNQGGPSANFAYRYSCKVCHGDFAPNTIPPPGHRIRESEDGQTGWHHFRYEDADEDGGSGNVAYCSGDACHGADGKSNGTAAGVFPGIAAHGPACSNCH